MLRRRVLLWSAVGLGCILLISGGLAAGILMSDEPPRPRHVVLIILDALRADHLGVYGSSRTRTPAIDRLAREGVVFERAYAQSSWTRTSVASLFTGTYPDRHAVYAEVGENSALPEGVTTLAEVLKARGFRTIGVSANPHVSPSSGFGQGFDLLHRPPGSAMIGTTSRVVAALEKHLPLDDGTPLFLFIHFLDPHDPYAPRSGCEQRLGGLSVADASIREGHVFRVSGEHDLRKEAAQSGGLARCDKLPRPHPLSEDEIEYLRRLYDCEIEEVDRALNRVLALLEQRGFLRQAAVVLLADHGEEFLDHGLFRHGYQLYEESVRVPLIISAPELAHERWPAPAELVDIFPTVLALTGTGDGGRNLDGEVLGPVTGVRPASARAFGVTRFRKQNLAYLVEDDSKLVVDFKRGRRTLYDLKADPREKQGREALATERGRAMLRRLQELAGRKAVPGRQRAPMDEQLKQQLRSLGYME